MKTEEAKKNIQETLSKLESFNRDSDPVFSSLLQVLSSLIIVIISAFETLQTSFNQLQTSFNQYIVTKMDNESINFAIDVANSVLFQIVADK